MCASAACSSTQRIGCSLDKIQCLCPGDARLPSDFHHILIGYIAAFAVDCCGMLPVHSRIACKVICRREPPAAFCRTDEGEVLRMIVAIPAKDVERHHSVGSEHPVHEEPAPTIRQAIGENAEHTIKRVRLRNENAVFEGQAEGTYRKSVRRPFFGDAVDAITSRAGPMLFPLMQSKLLYMLYLTVNLAEEGKWKQHAAARHTFR